VLPEALESAGERRSVGGSGSAVGKHHGKNWDSPKARIRTRGSCAARERPRPPPAQLSLLFGCKTTVIESLTSARVAVGGRQPDTEPPRISGAKRYSGGARQRS
jgi:hypothetical protein